MIEILIQVDRRLNAVLVDLLPEIPMPIEQANRNEIQVQIACGLAMIAGEYSETTGIIRDRFVKAKFGGEIGNRILNRASGARLSVSVVSSEIFLEFLKDLFQLAQKRFVLCELFQSRLPRKLEHPDRIMIRPVPKFGIEMSE